MLALVFLLAQAAAPAAHAEWARPTCPALRVEDPSGGTGSPHDSFSAGKTLDLRFRAVFPRRIDGEHLLELKLYAPSGHLYQVLSLPFEGSPAREAGKPAPGPAVGARRQALRPLHEAGRSRFEVSTQIPVAGTYISTRSLYGRWRVVPHLDGSPHPCGRERAFTLLR